MELVFGQALPAINPLFQPVEVMMSKTSWSAICWRNVSLSLLDQRRLPAEEVWLELTSAQDVADAIRDMVVRGAPAIGITAAYGVVLGAINQKGQQKWYGMVVRDIEQLAASRPTAVNLFWALERMKTVLDNARDEASPPVAALIEEARLIHEEDCANNQRMSALALSTMQHMSGEDPFSVMTHCNTGALATGGHGTALGIIKAGASCGMIEHVHVNETRPWMQGARLTSWELSRENIPLSLNVESAAALIMSKGNVKWLIVGADRIAANGDVANKIGTYTLAIAARYHGVKVMVAAPLSSFDLTIQSGGDIPVEERAGEEIMYQGNTRIAPENINAFNPVFDITPAALIDVIVTEKGVIAQPTQDNIKNHVRV
ncbi:S-methyl-5-thioribose-1-phosphate isomerase [Larsenimonas rhizosphaerae]|nr:S-methyl-5-thioribose-1-phosphate isomerase [Larsenimonas rhizosphaerae]